MKLLKATKEKYDHLVENVADWKSRDTNEAQLNFQEKATRAYVINTTGNCCCGDQILFVERVWEKQAINRFGKMANVVVDYRLIEGTIINDSYGAKKQQHTFTIKLKDGSKKLIKGRNLYGVAVWRKLWTDEGERQKTLEDKYERGDAARMERALRHDFF